MTDMHPIACAIGFAAIVYATKDEKPDDPIGFGDWVIFLMMLGCYLGIFLS